jgi:hypothetical protein
MLALTFIKGPLVDDWAADQVQELENKVNHPTTPVDIGEEILWTEFIDAFNSNFADVTQKQLALSALYQLRMQKDRFDDYVAAFKHYAKQADFELSQAAIIRLFAMGIEDKLLDAILHRETQPETIPDYITAAHAEIRKHQNRQSIRHPGNVKFGWTPERRSTFHTPQSQLPRQYGTPTPDQQPTFRAQQSPRHYGMSDPDPDPQHYPTYASWPTPQRDPAFSPPWPTYAPEAINGDPMDIDPPSFAKLRRIYERAANRKQCRATGACYRCFEQGHLARDCYNRPPRDYDYHYYDRNTHTFPLQEDEEDEEESEDVTDLAEIITQLPSDERARLLDELTHIQDSPY